MLLCYTLLKIYVVIIWRSFEMIKKEFLWGENAREWTVNLLKTIALKYGLNNLLKVLENPETILFKKDIYICIENIVEAVVFQGNSKEEKLESLKSAKNVYNAPIFIADAASKKYNIVNLPDFYRLIDSVRFFEKSLKLNVYNTVNTILTLLVAQVIDVNLNEMFYLGIGHIERSIENAFLTNSTWTRDKETSDKPVLVMPIGAAGCGKSTFYKVIPNLVNISCDNIRYLLFSKFGPSFSSWESTISWWVVNNLTDFYLRRGYSVFFNGVNTDQEYRTPLTGEVNDPIYEGIKFNIKLVYFEPTVMLNDEELSILKSVDLWSKSLDDINFDDYPEKVRLTLEFIKLNYERTVSRTQKINEGTQEQDPYDILYLVPPAIVKLFVEQSFVRPTGENVIYIPRKNIPDDKEREDFYKSFVPKVFE